MKQTGFTLIELLITLTIVAILSAVAIPSYTQYVQKSRRSEAMAALLRIANAQQKYLLANNERAPDLATLGITATTESGDYSLSMAGDEASASATSSGAQAGDTECKSFRINLVTGRKSSQKADGSSNTEPGTCWPA